MHPLHEHINRQIKLSNADFDTLIGYFKTVHFKKGDQIILPQQSITHQYFVLKGCLRTFLLDANGKEHTIQFAVENWWVSDYIAYYKNTDAVLTVECIEDCALLKIDQADIHVLFDKVPLVERFFRLQLENAFVAFQTRILSNLRETAEKRYLLFIKAYPDIEQRVKNYQIASFLGITPESLSRLRKQRIASK